MARPNTIPDELVPLCLELSAKGNNNQQIADHLLSYYNLEVNDNMVQRRIQSLKKIDQEARQTAIREEAAKQAINHLEIINSNITVLQQKSSQLLEEGEVMKAAKLKDILLKYIQLSLGTGTGQPETPAQLTDEEADEAILAKIVPQRSNRSN